MKGEIDWQDPQLTEAVLTWTGFRSYKMPSWDKAQVGRQLGASASRYLEILEGLAEDFYSSDAKNIAADLPQMEAMAISDFKSKHPGVPDEIARALGWCYSFDNR